MKRDNKIISEEKLEKLTKGGIAVCLATLIGITSVCNMGIKDKAKAYGTYSPQVTYSKNDDLRMPVGFNLEGTKIYRDTIEKAIKGIEQKEEPKTHKIKENNTTLEVRAYKVENFGDNEYAVDIYKVEPAIGVSILQYNADGTPAKGEVYYTNPNGGMVLGNQAITLDKQYVVSDSAGKYVVSEKIGEVIPAYRTTQTVKYSDGTESVQVSYTVPEGYTLNGHMGYRTYYREVTDPEVINNIVDIVKAETAGDVYEDNIKTYKVENYGENEYMVNTYNVVSAPRYTIKYFNADGTPAKGETFYTSINGGVLVDDRVLLLDKQYIVSDSTGEYCVNQIMEERIAATQKTTTVTLPDGTESTKVTYTVPEGYMLSGKIGYRTTYKKVTDPEVIDYIVNLVKVEAAGIVNEGEVLELEKRSR